MTSPFATTYRTAEPRATQASVASSSLLVSRLRSEISGEIERRGDEVGGLAIHLAARVMDRAESGGIVVSSTVRDLVVGSRLEFAACGSFDLKGIPGSWDLYEVV